MYFCYKKRSVSSFDDLNKLCELISKFYLFIYLFIYYTELFAVVYML